ncbi:MAG: cytochrome b561 domain-containing protein [Pseudomonadota bacterium]
MSEPLSHIPTEAHFFGQAFEIHWNYHAVLMFFVWIVLVPLCITVMRFHKPPPSEKGIQRDVSLWHREWWFFSVHKFGLFLAMILALGGTGIAWIASNGFSGSVHAWFGTLTVALGLGQIVSSQMRGTRGGKYRDGSDPNDPSTWRGDQYDRTSKRRIFEAVHKTTGYFTVLFAFGAVGSGLMQYHMPVLTVLFVLTIVAFAGAWAVYEFKGRAYDGYRVAHGYGLEHPYNKAREFL